MQIYDLTSAESVVFKTYFFSHRFVGCVYPENESIYLRNLLS